MNKKAAGLSSAAVSLSMLIFGTVGLVRKMIPLGSGLVASARGITGALVLLLFSFAIKKPVSLKNLKKSLFPLLLSGIAMGINWILLFEAYSYTTVAAATLCYYMAPVFVILLSPLLLREKLTVPRIICITVSTVGMVLVSGVFESGFTGLRGILLALGAAALYASVVLINQKIRDIPPVDRTFTQLATAGIVLIPYVLLAEGLPSALPGAGAVISLAVICLVHTGIAYLLYFGGMTGCGAVTASLLSYIDPLTAVILSALVLKEPMSILGWIGAVLILGSTAAVELSGMKKK